MKKKGGYTLIELMVAVGLFAIIMLLASGAYIMMIGFNRQAQGLATGIDNLSFALETMTRNIRTGSGYNCGGGDCSGLDSFSFLNEGGKAVSYIFTGSVLQETIDGVQSNLTDPLSVTVTSLKFYVSGTEKASASPPEYTQPHVTITVSGTVSVGPGKPAQSFTVETGATMRGSDL